MGAALVVSPQELWKFGLQERVQRGTPITLVGRVDNGVAESRYTTLRRRGLAAGYQVTAGRTLILTRIRYRTTVSGTELEIGSGTTDVGDDSVAAPGGVLSLNSFGDGTSGVEVTAGGTTIVTADVYYEIAAARFPFIRNLTASSAAMCEFDGVEV